jgi:hypothetical protein
MAPKGLFQEGPETAPSACVGLEGVRRIARTMSIDMLGIAGSRLPEGVVVRTADIFLRCAGDCTIRLSA